MSDPAFFLTPRERRRSDRCRGRGVSPSSSPALATSSRGWGAHCRRSGQRSSGRRIRRTGSSARSSRRVRSGTTTRPSGSSTSGRRSSARSALGTIVSDWLRSFGIAPAAMIGYSLGESAGLFALCAWTERDEMLAAAGRVAAVPNRAGRPLRRRAARLGTCRGQAGGVAGRDHRLSGRDGPRRPGRPFSGLSPDCQRTGRNRHRRRPHSGRTAGRRPGLSLRPVAAGQHGPLPGGAAGRDRLPRAAPARDHAAAGYCLLQWRLGARVRARPRNRRRGDRRAGIALDRLPSARRACLRRWLPRLRRGRPRWFMLADDHRDPRRPPPSGAPGLPRWARPPRDPPRPARSPDRRARSRRPRPALRSGDQRRRRTAGSHRRHSAANADRCGWRTTVLRAGAGADTKLAFKFNPGRPAACRRAGRLNWSWRDCHFTFLARIR